MQWHTLYSKENEPTEEQIRQFTATPCWDTLTSYLQQTYQIQPTLFYSGCRMEAGKWQGWNVKYKKSGKALCTLYPKEGYFVALIPISSKEIDEAELLLPHLTPYTQKQFNQTPFGHYGKSLALEVTSDAILQDAKSLIALRIGTKKNRRGSV